MSAKNPEYDFKWCPGCGDFGVRRALEAALSQRSVETELPAENTVVVAGIGCSGNMIHLLEGDMPYGLHGIHGRTLPLAMGVKMGRPDLNVVIVAGDGDFLGIGLEHIGPQAARNLDVTAVIMDNQVYGLTKGQSSPTTGLGAITSSTPYGKPEEALDALRLYLTVGASYVASTISTKVRDLGVMIQDAMNHKGFSVVHVQSPCTTYNNTFEVLKGNPRKGIAPLAWDIPDDHDETDQMAAFEIASTPGVPVGVLYRDESRLTFDQRSSEMAGKETAKTPEELLASYAI